MITRGQVVQGIRDRIADDSTSPFYQTALLNRLINERALVLSTTVICRLDPSFYMDEQVFTTTAAQQDYIVDTKFSSLVSAERKYGTGISATFQVVPVILAEDQSIFGYVYPLLALPDTLSRQNKSISLIGQYYRLQPIPVDNQESYRIKFLRKPVPTDPESQLEAVDIPDSWFSVLVLDCVKVIYSRKGDPRMIAAVAEYDVEMRMIRKHARRRTASQPIGRLARM